MISIWNLTFSVSYDIGKLSVPDLRQIRGWFLSISQIWTNSGYCQFMFIVSVEICSSGKLNLYFAVIELHKIVAK